MTRSMLAIPIMVLTMLTGHPWNLPAWHDCEHLGADDAGFAQCIVYHWLHG